MICEILPGFFSLSESKTRLVYAKIIGSAYKAFALVGKSVSYTSCVQLEMGVFDFVPRWFTSINIMSDFCDVKN